MHPFSRCIAAASALAALASCHSADPIDLYAVATPRSATTDCVADRSRSTAVSFTPVDLGPAAVADSQHGEIVSAAIGESATDARTWAAVWRRLADTVPPPSLDFTNRVLLVAATDLRAHPTIYLDIGAVRQCTATGAVAVLVRLTAPKGATDEIGPRRVVAAAWAPAASVGRAQIEFVRAPPAYAGLERREPTPRVAAVGTPSAAVTTAR